MSSVSENIAKIEQEIETLKKVVEKFPDLKEYKGRWQSYYTSGEALKLADKINVNHSCGCCPDAALYVKPYLEYLGIKIFCPKPEICIGEGTYSGPDNIDDNWKEILEKEGVTSPKIYELVSDLVEENAKEWKECEADKDNN